MFFSLKLSADDHFGFGFGLTTDNYIVSDYTFTVPVLHVYYEYQVNSIAVLTLSYIGLNVYFPVLALEAGLFVDVAEELGLKGSIGYFSDASFNGHMGLIVSGSIIVNKSIEFKFFGVPVDMYSQPHYSVKDGFYDGSFIKNENGLYDIKRGYLGLLMCLRF